MLALEHDGEHPCQIWVILHSKNFGEQILSGLRLMPIPGLGTQQPSGGLTIQSLTPLVGEFPRIWQ